MEQEHERRKLDRHSAIAQGKVRLCASIWLPVVISDITIEGCRVNAASLSNSPGEVVWLKLENLCSMEAEVRWVLPQSFGIQFKEPLHPAVVDHLVYTSRVAGEDLDMKMLDQFGRELPKLGQRLGNLRSC